jgi:signal transduction histidine kinase
MLTSFILIFSKLRSTKISSIEKKQLGFLIIGTLLASILGTFFNLFLPLAYSNYDFVKLGPSFVFLMIIPIAYSIFKHRLFDIKIVATELLTFTLWVLLLLRTILSSNQKELWVNGSLLVATIIIGTFLIRSVIREIAQREKIEKLAIDLERSNTELELANERLKELDKQKTEFVSIASHQLRSPLTAIKGYSSMLLEGSFGKLADKPREAVQVVFESSQKLVGVIEDFLNITRIELGKMKYDKSIIDMGKMVESVVNELKPNVMRRGLTMTFTGSDGPYNIYADSGKLNQVFLNVIDNAIKYTEKGSITVEVARKQEGDKTLIRFTSTDTGVGTDEKTISRLFEKFVRASDAGNINITGTGLGLFVAKQIVEAHGGKIWAESEGKGKGSKFIVENEENKTVPVAETTSVTPAPEIQVEKKAVGDLAKAI